MKYVILQVMDPEAECVRVYPVWFSDRQTHSVVATAMITAVKAETHKATTVFGAGLCWIDDESGRWECQRGSASMGIPLDHGMGQLSQRDADVLNMPEAMQGMLLEGQK